MKIQIIVAPSEAYPTTGPSAKAFSVDPPYGAMYIAGALLEDGHSVRIETCDIDRLSDNEILERIREFEPEIIGLSAIVASSYKYVKKIASLIKREFPHVTIVMGGGLAAAAETVLKNTAVDVVVIGEGDMTIREIASAIARKETHRYIDGIAFKDGGELVMTSPRRVIVDLDALKYPAFDLVDMKRYMIDIRECVSAFRHYKDPDRRLFEPHRSAKMLRIMISRGCTGRCSFCYRPTPGLRYFSFDYIFDYLEYIIEKFGVNIFSFGDECFARNKEWNIRFARGLRDRKLDIMFQVLGMRVDTVDYDVLAELKEAGCFMILYGFESGSQKILDIMEKRVTVEQNVQAGLLTKKAGIFTSPNFIFGMPGETTETVRQSVDFLKRIGYGANWYQYAYPLAVPGTPLYEYARAASLIKDEDRYLDGLYYANVHNLIDTESFINFTSADFQTVRGWPKLIEDDLLKYYSRNRAAYFADRYLRLDGLIYSLKRFGAGKTLRETLRRIFHMMRRGRMDSGDRKDDSSDRRRYLDMVRSFVSGNEERLSLRQIVKRIREDGVQVGRTQ